MSDPAAASPMPRLGAFLCSGFGAASADPPDAWRADAAGRAHAVRTRRDAFDGATGRWRGDQAQSWPSVRTIDTESFHLSRMLDQLSSAAAVDVQAAAHQVRLHAQALEDACDSQEQTYLHATAGNPADDHGHWVEMLALRQLAREVRAFADSSFAKPAQEELRRLLEDVRHHVRAGKLDFAGLSRQLSPAQFRLLCDAFASDGGLAALRDDLAEDALRDGLADEGLDAMTFPPGLDPGCQARIVEQFRKLSAGDDMVLSFARQSRQLLAPDAAA